MTVRRETIQGTLFTEGDIIIAVEWLDRLPEDEFGLTFVKWKDPSNVDQEAASTQCIVNSSELRAIDIPLSRRLPLAQTLMCQPPVRRSGRLAGVVEPMQSPEPDNVVFEMMPDVDARIRNECW